MALYDKEAMRVMPGGLLIGKNDVIDDPNYIRITRTRRRQLGQMTVALDVDSVPRRIPKGPYYISRKIDGEFTCLIFRDGEICTLNPGGTVRAEAPFLEEAAKALEKAGIKNAVFGGELYVQRSDGKRPRVHDVVRVARSPDNAEEVAQLAMGFFNIYDLDGEDLSMRYGEAITRLQEIFKGCTKVHPVETIEGTDPKGVLKQFGQWVENEGEEGVVARSDATGVFKVKPRHNLDLAVVGFTESINDREGLLHDMLLAVVRPDETYQIISRVGGGFSEEQRAEFLTMLKERVVESDFREVNSDRVAYQMVEPGLVAEIQCLDLISRTSRDNTIDRMVLEWNSDDARWVGVRRLPLCSILSPQFVRFRDDKKANSDDVRIKQVTDIVEIPEVDRAAEEIKLPASELLKRSVATKELRGATMVRKILMWKTNKEDASRDFPAYVLHVTDFSPNRKSQINYDLRVCQTRKQMDEMFEGLRKKLFVKGWEEQKS